MSFQPARDPFDLQKLHDGNAKIFNDVFNPHIKPLYLMAYQLLGNNDDAEDIVAEMRFKLWKNKETMTSEEHVKAFLIRSARNLCIDKLRGTDRERRIKKEYAEWIKAGDGDMDNMMIYDEVERTIHKEMILNEIDKMPRRCKEVAMHYLFGKMSMSEAAEKMGIKLTTARTLWKQAKDLLRESLQKFR